MRQHDWPARNVRHDPPPSLWDEHAEAMRLITEGNRLIAREVAAAIARLWRELRRRRAGPTRHPAMLRRPPSG